MPTLKQFWDHKYLPGNYFHTNSWFYSKPRLHSLYTSRKEYRKSFQIIISNFDINSDNIPERSNSSSLPLQMPEVEKPKLKSKFIGISHQPKRENKSFISVVGSLLLHFTWIFIAKLIQLFTKGGTQLLIPRCPVFRNPCSTHILSPALPGPHQKCIHLSSF